MTEKTRIERFKKVTLNLIPSEDTETLQKWGFFSAPSSRKYHGSYKGGLFDHSHMVMAHLIALTEQNSLKWERGWKSPIIVGMFHDLCKVDDYVRIPDGTEKSQYEYNKNTFLTGHGDKSVMLLSSLIKLTMEEVACIRYHMGAFTDKEEWRSYTRAVKQYPNVLWTHHADMLAAHVEGV